MAGKNTERLRRAQAQREGSWRPTAAVARNGRQAEAGALQAGFDAKRAEAEERDRAKLEASQESAEGQGNGDQVAP